MTELVVTELVPPDGTVTPQEQSAGGAPQLLKPSASRPEAVDVDDFLRETDASPDYVIPGLLARTERLILTGPEGGGKSTLARQIGLFSAAGVHPFTGQPMQPVRVLLVDLENNRQQVRSKIGPVRSTLGQLDGRFRLAVEPHGLALNDAADVAWLQSLVAAHQPDLLVIGPMYRLQGDDPNDEQVAKAASAALDGLRLAHAGCALVLEAHTPHSTANGGKIRRPYGASLWKRWPEFGLYLEADPENPNREAPLRPWRGGRDERDWPTRLRRSGNGTWEQTTVSVAQRPALLDRVVAALAGGQPVSNKALARRLGVRDAEIGSVIHEGIQAGLLHRENNRAPVTLVRLPLSLGNLAGTDTGSSHHHQPTGTDAAHA